MVLTVITIHFSFRVFNRINKRRENTVTGTVSETNFGTEECSLVNYHETAFCRKSSEINGITGNTSSNISDWLDRISDICYDISDWRWNIWEETLNT